MLQIRVLAVGKIKEKYLEEGLREYEKRLKNYVRLEIKEIADEPCPERYSLAEEEKVKDKEGEKLLRQVSEQDYVIALDLKGKEWSSEELAAFLQEKSLQGQSRLTFVIGGSLGLSKQVLMRADTSWSFSLLTFPHQLIRLILLEQIYRACKIGKGEPYHK